MKLDQVDIMILEELRKDSRQSMRELSKKVNLSAPSVTERVRRMEDAGIIEGYSIRINHRHLGLVISCILEITVKNGDYKRFQEKIQEFSKVEFCYRITGPACYIAKLNVSSLEEVETFINELTNVAATVTHVIFSEVACEHTLVKMIEAY
ncbi:Lrp/AsnC family transcriptional regulator [Cytobacillus sp. FJAT-54145]|uniref:Lrp/AsnC family transcriptional regulator n=1 Tax=Cytobacillus spartinae TaxID=3299023 RepID=A0ABW6KHW2_9BACI